MSERRKREPGILGQLLKERGIKDMAGMLGVSEGTDGGFNPASA